MDSDYDSELDQKDPMRNIQAIIDAHTSDLGSDSELIRVLPGQHYSVDDKTLHLVFRHNKLIEPLNVKIRVDASPGCGGKLWPAGQILASYIAKRSPNSLVGKNILELGSGTGLVGIVAALMGGNAWITDQLPLLDIMHRNVALNGMVQRCHVAELNWGEPLPCDIPRPDIVLAADCVYFEPAFPLLVQTLVDLIDKDTEVLFCYKKRRKADKRFFTMLKKKFTWTEVFNEPESKVYQRESLSLIQLSVR